MSTTDNGGLVFPALAQVGDFFATVDGLTVRDYFAGNALNALLTAEANCRHTKEQEMLRILSREVRLNMLAEDAYAIADALLHERNK